jgi:hypothetical protein
MGYLVNDHHKHIVSIYLCSRSLYLVCLCLYLCLFLVPTLYAQGSLSTTPSKKTSLQKYKANPSVHKKSLWRVAPIPLLNYNSGTGLGYGAFLSIFKKSQTKHIKGARHDFALNLQFYQTTGSYSYHKLMLDAPRLNKAGVRIQLMGGYESWEQAWYSGLDSTLPLQQDLLEGRYYQHKIGNIWSLPSIMQPIPVIHPSFVLFFTTCIRLADIEVYTDSLLDQQDVLGKSGGTIIQGSLGIMWDNRDRDPDTQQGIWSEVSGRYSSTSWGSDYEMWGVNLTHRQWIPLTQRKNLVWAYMIGMDYQGGQIPFFQRNIMGGSQWVELGGNSALRGYQRGRLRGDINVYTIQELRWRLGSFLIKKREVNYQMTPIFDLGYVTHVSNLTLRKDLWSQMYTSFGAGARFVYDESFVLRLDFAFATERVQAHAKAPIQRKLLPGFFAIVNHTF